MVNCPKCGAAVREEKAFCHNCGTAMDAVMRQREETPMPDFGATIIEPPRPNAPVQPPYAPPTAVTGVQPASRPTSPVQQPPQPQVHAAGGDGGALSPLTLGKRKSSRKIGFIFVIFLLFLMFVVFVLALLID
ncbi:MAG TPA: zinc-ribbon domain-containing protein [Pyrinomonadaceae bacterium]|nr:zinc-ribbon domain-containing protein [Pyrinomonadaceae bacterium]